MAVNLIDIFRTRIRFRWQRFSDRGKTICNYLSSPPTDSLTPSPADSEMRRSSFSDLQQHQQHQQHQVFYNYLDIPNWSSPDHANNNSNNNNGIDIDTILKLLFSPRNSHFHNIRTKSPRNSLETSSRSQFSVNHLKSVSEMYHSQRRNTLGALGLSRRESFQLQIMRDQVEDQLILNRRSVSIQLSSSFFGL